MYQLQQTDVFASWLVGLRDVRAQARILARLESARLGNLGDCKAIGSGIREMRIHTGPGYRVYLSRQGPVLVLLLCGSDKSSQSRAIEQAIDHLNDWKQRGKP